MKIRISPLLLCIACPLWLSTNGHGQTKAIETPSLEPIEWTPALSLDPSMLSAWHGYLSDLYAKSTNGDREATHQIAELQRQGYGRVQDYRNPTLLKRKALAGGDSKTLDWYAWELLHGRYGFEKNETEGVRLLEKAALEMGNPLSLRALGELYRRGKYVEKDLGKAMACFDAAFQNGLTDAKVGKGNLLLWEFDRVDDALYEYEQAAARGSRKAWVRMGALFLAKKQNGSKAVECFKRASQLGDRNADYSLALLYLGRRMDLVELDIDQGLRYLERALKAPTGRIMRVAPKDFPSEREVLDLSTIPRGADREEAGVSVGNEERFRRYERMLQVDPERTARLLDAVHALGQSPSR